jgi:pimeloyl-ACP methyl ester carboxylesterase
VADQKGIENFSVFGYSMGGYIAACMASQQPERVEKFITLGTKYHWSQDVAAEQKRFLDPEKIILKTPAFAASLENLHGSAWRSVVNKTAQLMAELGKHPLLQKQDYCKIVAKALVIKGDRDSMVTLPECVDLCSMLPNAGFCILPFTPHPFEKVNQEILYTLASQFFNHG